MWRGLPTNYAAKMLADNRLYLSARHPNFTADELLQATAASFNLGPYGFSGIPSNIDTGSAGTPRDGYGANVVQLMECFK